MERKQNHVDFTFRLLQCLVEPTDLQQVQATLYPKYTAKFLTGSFVQEMFSYLSLVCFTLPSQIPSVLFLFNLRPERLYYYISTISMYMYKMS
jgi:hypothetical protein